MTRITYDVFICHASEDKEAIARPLAEALKAQGVTVWYDDFVLSLGDSLRREIERGLTSSRFGIVILSPAFFGRAWPQQELDGLVALEIQREARVILPLWHNVSTDFVCRYSPILADRMATPTSVGLPTIVTKILRVVRTSQRATPEATSAIRSPQTENVLRTLVGLFGTASFSRSDVNARVDADDVFWCVIDDLIHEGDLDMPYMQQFKARRFVVPEGVAAEIAKLPNRSFQQTGSSRCSPPGS